MTIERELRITDAPAADHFDLLVVALGYEERSAHVAKAYGQLASRKVALAFRFNQTLSYGSNALVLERLGFEIVPIDDEAGTQVMRYVEELAEAEYSVGIDVSSFTRLQLAQIVEAIAECPRSQLSVDFLYAPAQSGGWETETGPITVAEPIHPTFTSWTDDPTRPLAALIGVGIEDNLALGVAEYLDVSSVYAFVPVGGDPGFDVLNEAANHDFLGTNYVVHRADYDLRQPFELFARLESLIYGIAPDTRVAIVPLGPKLFALCGLLATAISNRSATVWRFSWTGSAEPSDRKAAGPTSSLRVEHVATGRSKGDTATDTGLG